MTEAFITHRKDLWLGVEKARTDAGLELRFRLKGTGNQLLHWGLASRKPGAWQKPPEQLWPAETRPFSQQAVQTPFQGGDGEKQLIVRLDEKNAAPFLVFDLFSPDNRRWENNNGKDFYLALTELKPTGPSPAEMLESEIKNAEVISNQIFPLDSGEELAAVVVKEDGNYQLLLLTDAAGPLMLHWGVSENARPRWKKPALEIQPQGTTPFDDSAVRTPFVASGQLQRLQLTFSESTAPGGVGFVLFAPATNQWLKHRAQNIFVPILPRERATADLSGIAAQIVEGEMGEHGWTLMHRFNLCHDLIDQVGDSREGWATIFVWLRFSAVRQLDWQRNYNTKPRELTHSQDRLTFKLASLWRQQPANRDLIRLALTCVGRGGEGQRIRDEILQIMHRHHVKEVGGSWMEQWHQKLHNNTTPDDIAICEAYLEFLRQNGNRDAFYATLGAHGVTRERLASFDRPLTVEPEFIPHLRDALLWEFENFLKLLKSVHSAGDLETAANNAGQWLDELARNGLNFIRQQFRNPAASTRDLVASAVAARRSLAAKLENESDVGRMREMLYLDLALEEILRGAVERNIHTGFSGEQLLELIGLGSESVTASASSPELSQCQRELKRLPGENRFSPDWSLHAKAAVDRLGRAISDGIDHAYRELQPIAEKLGAAFHADEWAVKLFSEEVVRGRPAFVLSLLIRHLDPLLRKSARLGDWQVISPSTAVGRVEVVETVREIQGKKFDAPTIVVAEKVFGDEEPPENVRAVITTSSVDLVSHVAVRARNASLLFATCHDRGAFDKLRALKGKLVQLKVSASGDVLLDESVEPLKEAVSNRAVAHGKFTRANPTLKVLRMDEFSRDSVGGKSVHLKILKEKLPERIQTPRSIALPFGVFEAVLTDKSNRAVAARYAELTEQIEAGPAAKLAEIREIILKLELPAKLLADIERSMQAAGLQKKEASRLDPRAATRIKQVWASKWNERAFFSRAARHWPHDAVQMAVLIQQVIEAEYAFVIHTTNPFNGNPDELYAEVVRGLGETLVGNYPGRAMSAVCAKKNEPARVLAYPAKSLGLFGGGLIFRSDSNAEDLEGYAGAGLYDSVLLEPPREEVLDYTADRLVWDEKFCREFFTNLVQLGREVEMAFGSPQDIEGACVAGKFFVVQSRPQVGL